MLTGLFTMGIFITGRMLTDLGEFAAVTENATVAQSVEVLRRVLPNLDLFDVRAAVVHDLPIESGHLVWALLYTVLYSVGLVLAAELLFRRREFK